MTLDSKWLTIRMGAEDYAIITGHSEGYVRRCFPPDGQIRIRVLTEDLMDNIHDIRGIRKGEGE